MIIHGYRHIPKRIEMVINLKTMWTDLCSTLLPALIYPLKFKYSNS